MPRKAAKKTEPEAPPRPRGRPPLAPRTTLARWLQERRRTITEFTEELRKLAPRFKIDDDQVPENKTMTDAVNARHWPHPRTILLVRHATDGAVDLEHWVRDWAGIS